jgi:hypothetical protein
LKSWTWSNPLTVRQTSLSITENVDVLIPPPVDEDEPPINIRAKKIKIIGRPTELMFTELKPEVLVTLWNTDVVNFPNPDKPESTPFHSRMAKAIEPNTTNISEK